MKGVGRCAAIARWQRAGGEAEKRVPLLYGVVSGCLAEGDEAGQGLTRGEDSVQILGRMGKIGKASPSIRCSVLPSGRRQPPLCYRVSPELRRMPSFWATASSGNMPPMAGVTVYRPAAPLCKGLTKSGEFPALRACFGFGLRGIPAAPWMAREANALPGHRCSATIASWCGSRADAQAARCLSRRSPLPPQAQPAPGMRTARPAPRSYRDGNRIAELEERIESSKLENHALRKQLAGVKGSWIRSPGLFPPSSKPMCREKSRKRPGRKAGHEPAHRPAAREDRPPRSRCRCRGMLAGRRVARTATPSWPT